MSDEKLPPEKQKYVEARAKGLSGPEAAAQAGIAYDRGNTPRMEASTQVAAELARIRKEAAENAGVTKEMVAQGFKDAAEMARTMADPNGMVAAWRELGRMLGFYAPEVKKVEKGINKKDLRRALEDLSDAELQDLAQGRVIDGEFKRVGAAEVPQLPAK